MKKLGTTELFVGGFRIPVDDLRINAENGTVELLHKGEVQDELGILWLAQRTIERKLDLYDDQLNIVFE